jgi:hypothetical protein
MGVVFGLFAGFYYWIELLTGLKYSDILGRIHFWLTFVGVNMTFFPMHFLGIAGMPRRISDYPDIYWNWNYISSVGSLVSVFGLLIFFWVLIDLLFETSFFVQVKRFGYLIVLNERLMSNDDLHLYDDEVLDVDTNVYLFNKYNFFNIFRSRFFYNYYDYYLYIGFECLYYRKIFSYYIRYTSKYMTFYKHLNSFANNQLSLFFYLVYVSELYYLKLFELKLIYVIVNKFLYLYCNKTLFIFLLLILKKNIFRYYLEVGNKFNVDTKVINDFTLFF